MASPLLTAVAAPISELAIASILATLRDDPTVLAAGIRVIAPEGGAANLPENEPIPPLTLMPCIRFIRGASPSRWEAHDRFRLTLPMNFELFCEGTHYADAERMLAALYFALFPPDDDRRVVVKSRVPIGAIGETFVGMTKPVHLGAGLNCQAATATYTVTLDLQV